MMVSNIKIKKGGRYNRDTIEVAYKALSEGKITPEKNSIKKHQKSSLVPSV